ncbi:MAG: glutamate 5-kinase [Candidatus Omnitrophica bacterium CG10_big_fil_rev_8_21_14_0_10_43_8]|nr:MAG: glutamate 5-kinase [Candidatus Omnitrophica bacterium CG10_big_fil_rev_8_21_14_0_10_43_8]
MALDFSNAKLVVLKLGTQVAVENGLFNSAFAESLAKTIAERQAKGKRFVIVSSGAIGLGKAQFGVSLEGIPKEIPLQQASAAVGQILLMDSFKDAFSKFGVKIGQVLLTQHNFADAKNLRNLKNTVGELLRHGVVPVINENDAVAVEELASKSVFSDNDVLSALVAVHLKAQLLVIFTGVEGLYDKDPLTNGDAKIIRRVSDVSKVDVSLKGKSASGRGGFETKMQAAKIVLKKGVPLIIAKGEKGALGKILSGAQNGTLFMK